MRLDELFMVEGKDDADHFDALEKTGFFGSAGAGCLFVARDTGRFLFSHRSQHVEQPGDWAGWGGAIDSGEDPVEAVKREVHEEAGYNGKMDLIPMLVFKKNTFRYYNFLAVVEHEFKPKLDWESQGYKWVEYGDWPHRLHFGVISLLNDQTSVALMKKYAKAKE